MKNAPSHVAEPSADYADFMQLLEEGKHLEPFPGETFKVNVCVTKIRKICDKYRIRPS